MKKKIITMVLLMFCLCFLSACASTSESSETAKEKEPFKDIVEEFKHPADATDTKEEEEEESVSGSKDIAMIVNVTDTDKKYMNQGIWKGITTYMTENAGTYEYYVPETDSDQGYIEAFEDAILGGAKMILCSGDSVKNAILDLQEDYPDVLIAWIDGSKDMDGQLEENVTDVHFDHTQAGFLAGAGTVIDTKKKLGFVGDLSDENTNEFLYGFVQGAEYAAETKKYNEVKLYYDTPKNAEESALEQSVSSMFDDGIEVVFTCGKELNKAAEPIAEKAKGYLIGFANDVTDSESENYLTLVANQYKMVSYKFIVSLVDGSFEGGSEELYGTKKDGVGLPIAKTEFTMFKETDYSKILDGIFDSSIEIKPYEKGASITDLELESIKVFPYSTAN